MAASSPVTSRKKAGVLSFDEEIKDQLVSALRLPGRFDVLSGTPDDFLSGQPIVEQCDIVILDIGDGALLEDARLGMAREALGNRVLVVISDDLSPERVRSVIRMRAADWLQKPVSTDVVLSSTSHLASELVPDASRVTTIIGATGGVGATTLALMAGQHLSAGARSKDTGVVDLDFHAASCGAYLNAAKSLDLDPIIANPDRLDAEMLESMKSEIRNRLSVYSFERPDILFLPNTRRFILRLLDLVSVRHQEVIIDLPNLETPWFDEIVRHSDKVIVVFETNILSLRQARRTVQFARQLLGGKGDVTPLANKTNFRLFGNPISRRDIQKMLRDGKFLGVSRDDALASDSINRGMLPDQISRQAKMVRDAAKAFDAVFGK